MNIRLALPADAAALQPLFEQLGYPTDAAEIRKRLERADEGRAVLVAIVDGRPAGFVAVADCEPFVAGRWSEVQGLVVAALWRGRGIGGALVAAAEDWAAKRGCRRMHVTSNVVRERAHGFYERCGYEIVKTQRVFEKMVPNV